MLTVIMTHVASVCLGLYNHLQLRFLYRLNYLLCQLQHFVSLIVLFHAIVEQGILTLRR